MATTVALPQPAATELPREWPRSIRQAATVVRSRRFGFYLDVLGALVVMSLFVAAAILV